MEQLARSDQRRISPLGLARRFVTEELGRSQTGTELRDAALIERSLDGDFAAFEALVTRYERRVFWIAFQLLGRIEDARDVTQEAFSRVYRVLDRFDFDRNFYTWLHRIVTNLAIDRARSLKARPTVPLDPDAGQYVDGSDEARPESRMERSEEIAMVRATVDELPEPFRLVLVLRDLQGLGCRDIAACTGLTYSTVRWRLARARQLFRERWQRKHAG